MKDRRKAYEEKLDAQLEEGNTKIALLKTRADNGHARSLAEAVILQSIEDLWHPRSKRGSLLFFEGDGFEICSEIAGISYIKQLAMLRMLADSGSKTSLCSMRKAL